MARLKPFFVLALLPFALTLRYCNTDLERTVTPSNMQQFYLDHGWIPLDIPDSKYGPGTIVQITKLTGIVYVSNIKTCGIPDQVLTVIPGSSPTLSLSGDTNYGAKAVLGIKGISIGPDWNKVKKTSLTVHDHGADAIDILKLQIWLTDPNNQQTIPKSCTELLSAPDTYIIREAYRVSKGKWTLYDENNMQIKLSGIHLGALNIEPGANSKITADGSLEFTEPAFTAIKRLRDTNGILQPLAPGATPTDADMKITALLFSSKNQ